MTHKSLDLGRVLEVRILCTWTSVTAALGGLT